MDLATPSPNQRTEPHDVNLSGGGLIACLRKKKGWSRGELVYYYQKDLERTKPEHSFEDVLSEPQLTRIERNERVKLDREVFDRIFRILGCTPLQQIRIISPFCGSLVCDPSSLDEILVAMAGVLHLHPRAKEMFMVLAQDENANALDYRALFATISEIFAMVFGSESLDISDAGDERDD